MSTFLQLAQKLRQETTDSGTGPSTVTGQTGELARFVSWIADAWQEIQSEREDWLFARKSFTVNTVAADADYAFGECIDTVTLVAIARFARWYEHTFKAFKSA